MKQKQAYYPRESSAILEVLKNEEMSSEVLFSRTRISPFVGMSLMQGLLREKAIVYRMVKGVQLFRINER